MRRSLFWIAYRFSSHVTCHKVVIGSLQIHYRFLHLNCNRRLTDRDLGGIVDGCEQLRVLTLAFCTSLSDDGLRHISRCEKLELLCLRRVNFTDNGIIAISNGCSNLEYLDVGWCTSVSEKFIRY